MVRLSNRPVTETEPHIVEAGKAPDALPASPFGGLPASPISLALRGACPKCGHGRLFSGILVLSVKCAHCGHDFADADPGDGPQVFVILILGAVVAVLAAMLHAALSPPAIVHLIIWPIVVSALGLWLLRFFKAWLIAQQYRHDAHEARLTVGASANPSGEAR